MKYLIGIALAAFSFAANPPKPAGRLIHSTQGWKREPSPEIRDGMLVNPGDVFWLPDSARPGSAEFILFDGTRLHCGDETRCEIPNVVPPPQSIWARMSSHPEIPHIGFTIARGETLNDSVLSYRDGSLDLSPAFSSLQTASYRITLRNLHSSGAALQFTYMWQARSPAPATVAIEPGLYELTALTPEEGMLGPSVVLISKPEAFAESRRTLDQELARLDQSKPRLSDITRRQFVLAILDAL